jgi:hypothetical protein
MNTYSVPLARFRILVLLQAIVNIAIYSVVFSRVGLHLPTGNLGWVVIVGLILMAFVVLEAVFFCLTFFYVKGTVSLIASIEALIHGLTWSGMAEMIRESRDYSKIRSSLEEKYPELKYDKNFLRACGDRNVMLLSVMGERMSNKERKAQQENERTARRSDLRESIYNDLVKQAQALGGYPSMWADRCQDIAYMRVVVAELERKNNLLQKAKGLGCDNVVRDKIDSESVEAGYVILSRIQKVRAMAIACGVWEQAQSSLDEGKICECERMVNAAANDCAKSDEQSRLITYVEERENCRHVRPQIEALSRLQYGSREYRKAIHVIHRSLGL